MCCITAHLLMWCRRFSGLARELCRGNTNSLKRAAAYRLQKTGAKNLVQGSAPARNAAHEQTAIGILQRSSRFLPKVHRPLSGRAGPCVFRWPAAPQKAPSWDASSDGRFAYDQTASPTGVSPPSTVDVGPRETHQGSPPESKQLQVLPLPASPPPHPKAAMPFRQAPRSKHARLRGTPGRSSRYLSFRTGLPSPSLPPAHRIGIRTLSPVMVGGGQYNLQVGTVAKSVAALPRDQWSHGIGNLTVVNLMPFPQP